MNVPLFEPGLVLHVNNIRANPERLSNLATQIWICLELAMEASITSGWRNPEASRTG
jgi:hypothetical protein